MLQSSLNARIQQVAGRAVMAYEVDVMWGMDSFFLTRRAPDALFSLTESTPLKVIWSCLQRAKMVSHYLHAVKSRSRESLCVSCWRHTRGGGC